MRIWALQFPRQTAVPVYYTWFRNVRTLSRALCSAKAPTDSLWAVWLISCSFPRNCRSPSRLLSFFRICVTPCHKKKGKTTTPFGVNLMGTPWSYWAAQVHHAMYGCVMLRSCNDLWRQRFVSSAIICYQFPVIQMNMRLYLFLETCFWRHTDIGSWTGHRGEH